MRAIFNEDNITVTTLNLLKKYCMSEILFMLIVTLFLRVLYLIIVASKYYHSSTKVLNNGVVIKVW